MTTNWERIIDWSKYNLGKKPDWEIAEESGAPIAAVKRVRRAKGIPPYRCPEIDWTGIPLGKVTDREAARMSGHSVEAVARARIKLDIPPHRIITEAERFRQEVMDAIEENGKAMAVADLVRAVPWINRHHVKEILSRLSFEGKIGMATDGGRLMVFDRRPAQRSA